MTRVVRVAGKAAGLGLPGQAAAVFDAVRDVLRTQVIGQLEALRADYAASRLPQDEKLARVAALDAKVDYLRGLPLDGNAHPWVGDRL